MASSPVAEAFVLIRPDLTGFAAQLQAELAKQIGRVSEPTINVRARVVGQVQAATKNIVASASTEAKALEQTGFAALSAAQDKARAAAVASAALKAEEAAIRQVQAAQAGALAGARLTALAQQQAAKQAQAAAAAGVAAAKAEAAALREAAREAAKHSRAVSQAGKGAFAAAAQFTGLRGAVLAASGTFLAATIAVTAFGKAISQGATLEQNLNVFAETAGATAEEMKNVADAAVRLGKDVTLPGVSAAAAAATMTELAKAGLSVQDSIDGARGVLLLATAANIDFAQASELAASALNSFGLAGDQATRVADVFAGAANAAQGSIQDFALANQQVDAVARQVGLSLEDTTALLAELAKNGLKGSDAGTSLRTALIRLVAPTTEARNLLDQLGVSIRDAQGNVDPLVFARFGEATKQLAPDLRDAITATIFGQDAIRAVAIAAREGEDGFRRMSEAVSQSGEAQRLADARSKGLKGSVSALVSSLETFGSTLSGTLIPLLTAATKGLTKFVDAATKVLEIAKKIDSSLPDGVVLKFDANVPISDLVKARDQIAAIKGEGDLMVKALDEAIKKLSNFRGPSLDEFMTNLSPSPFADMDEAIRRAQKINDVTSQLQAALRTFADTGFKDEAIRASILSLIDQMEQIGGPKVQATLRANMQGIANVLSSELQALSSDFGVQLEDLSDAVPAAMKRVIERLAQSPEGRASLRKFGQQLSDSLAEGIDDNSDRAAEAARKAVENAAKAVEDAERGVRDAVRKAGEDLINSVTQGRENLRTVGDQLSAEVGNLIQVGPLAQKAKALKAELDKIDARLEAFRRSRQRDSLESALTGAQADLDRQRRQLVTLGQGLTNAQKAKISDLLAPAQEKVAQATADIKEFRLEGQRDLISGRIEVVSQQVEDRADAAGKAVQTLVEQLRNGKIDADKFATSLQTLLAPQLKTLKSTAGKNLGLRFSTEFLTNLDTIVKQAQALAAFVSTPSASPVVNPAATQAAGRQSVTDARGRVSESQQALREAQANLDRTIKENAANQATTASNTTRMVNLLNQINQALKPSEKPGTTRAGGPKPDNNRSVKGSKVGGR